MPNFSVIDISFLVQSNGIWNHLLRVLIAPLQPHNRHHICILTAKYNIFPPALYNVHQCNDKLTENLYKKLLHESIERLDVTNTGIPLKNKFRHTSFLPGRHIFCKEMCLHRPRQSTLENPNVLHDSRQCSLQWDIMREGGGGSA